MEPVAGPRYSILALFVALSGTALALQRNSVGPRELKRDAVRSPHIKNGKVKTRDIAPAARVPKTVVRTAYSPDSDGDVQASATILHSFSWRTPERSVSQEAEEEYPIAFTISDPYG